MSPARFADRVRFIPVLHLFSWIYFITVSFRYPGWIGRQLKTLLLGWAALLSWGCAAMLVPSDAMLILALMLIGAAYCVVLCMIITVRNGIQQYE